MNDSGTQTTVGANDGPSDESPEETTTDDQEAEEIDTSHLDDVEDGCGCAEVWEHLSEERDD